MLPALYTYSIHQKEEHFDIDGAEGEQCERDHKYESVIAVCEANAIASLRVAFVTRKL